MEPIMVDHQPRLTSSAPVAAPHQFTSAAARTGSGAAR
jgi:hypothetical protein